MRWQALVAILLLCSGRVEAACTWPIGEVLKVSGEVQQAGLRGNFERTITPGSGRFVEAIDLGIIRTGSGFDGRLAWSRDASGASHYLTSDFARRLAASEAWLAEHLGCQPSAAFRVATHLGVGPVSHMDGWRFVPAGGAPIELWYDPQRRLDRAILQYSENRVIHHYSDWHELAPGRFIPFVQRDEDPEDESEMTYIIRRAVPASRAPSFAPPPLPKDSGILTGTSTTIPFEDDQRRRIFLPVYLNGKGPFTFELDNGGHFILTEETAAALKLTAQGSFASTGAGAEIRHGGYLPITELRVGGARVTDQTAKVLSLSHNDRGNLPPRAGILGLEFFERFIVAIDHRKKRITLRLVSDPAAPHPGQALPITFDEDAPLTAGGYGGAPGNVMLDIGNAGPTIVEHEWASNHGFIQRLSDGTPKGSAKLSRGAVRIGTFDLGDETVAYFGPAERGSEHTRSVAAIVGEPLLSRFNATYDYGHQKVWLERLPEMPPASFDQH